MNIKQFIHEIIRNTLRNQPTKIVYKNVNLYFGSLDYFALRELKRG